MAKPTGTATTARGLEALAKPEDTLAVQEKSSVKQPKKQSDQMGPNPAKAKIPTPNRGGKGSQVQVAGSFKKGGKVKKTAVYKLHKGEQVLNPKQAKMPAMQAALSGVNDNDADDQQGGM